MTVGVEMWRLNKKEDGGKCQVGSIYYQPRDDSIWCTASTLHENRTSLGCRNVYLHHHRIIVEEEEEA